MNRHNTIWKDIEGYNGYYQISNAGEIRSKSRFIPLITGGTRLIPGRKIKFKWSVDGYRFVTLSYHGKRKTHYLHRLVAEAFIPRTDTILEVNHIDGRKSNNRVENLEWVTHAENMAHARRLGLCSSGARHCAAVAVIDKATGLEYPTIKEAANAAGLNYHTMRNMLCGSNRNTTTMRYKEAEDG